MEFGIGVEADEEALGRCSDVRTFVNQLSEYIRSCDYGTGIEHFTIGLVAIRSKLGYEGWFKQRRPRFQKVLKIKILGHPEVERRNCYSFDIKPSDEEIDKFLVSGESAIEVFCERLIASFANLEGPSMKKRDFDLRKFRTDVLAFIDSWKLR